MNYRVGELSIDGARFEVRRAGTRLNVPRKVFDAILFLLERRDRVVPRAELAQHLWADVTVSTGSLGTLIKEARQALGDDGEKQSFILTVRGRGFRWVAPTEGGAGTPTSAAPPPLAIVGRRRELEAFEAALRDVDGARTMVVTGEAGIGKTRLARAMCDLGRRHEVRIAMTGCDEIEGAPADRPWREILRAMSGSAIDNAVLRDWLEGSSAGATDLRPEEARFRLFEAVVELVRSRCAEQSWLIVLDDLHAADPFTLSLTTFVARRIDGCRALLLGAWREPELVPSDPKNRWLLELRRTPKHLTFHLGGLSRGESAQLVRRLSPDATEHFIDGVHAEAAGNPFFLEEMVRASPDPNEPKPLVRSAALDTMLHQRLAGLGPTARRLLDAASVLGQEFSPRLAEAVAEIGAGECHDAWDELEDAGIVRSASEVEYAEERLAFAHGLLRAAIEGELGRAERVGLHGRAADVLEQQAPLSRYAWISELAHHRREAASLGSAKRAIAISREAAVEASKHLAFEDAARHLQGASALLEHVTSADDNPEARARLYLDLGEAQLAACQYAESRQSFLETLRLARLAGSPKLVAGAALGIGRPLEHINQPATDTVLVAALREALDALDPAECGLRARLLSRLAIALHGAAADPEGVVLSDRAVALAREGGDPDDEAYALLGRYWGLWHPGNNDAALACTTAMAQVGDRVAAGHLAAWYSLVHGSMLLTYGRADDARVQLKRQAEHVARTRRPHARAFVAMFEAMLAIMEWRPDDAERAMNEWFAIATQLGDEVLAQILFVVQLLCLRRQQGRAGELVPMLRGAVAGWPSIGTRSMLASCLHDAGEITEARSVYLAACADVERLKTERASYNLALVCLPELALAFEDEATARRLDVAFASTSGTHVVHPPGYQGPLARHLAIIAAAAGDRPRAARLLDEAAAAAASAGAPWWTERIRADRAMLGGRG